MYTKDTLVEIKKGESGKGLLIENDGFLSLDVKGNESIDEAVKLNEGEIGNKNLPRPFVVSAVFQKFGIENANGRIYPEAILKREVEKYQTVIRERRAYGECYTPDAMCLTKDGWKSIVDVKKGDSVLTLNTKTNKTEYQKVTYKMEKEWNGSMIHIKNSFIDDVITPDHEFPVYEMRNTVSINDEAMFNRFMSATRIYEMCQKWSDVSEPSYFIPCDEEPSMKKYGENTKRAYLDKRETFAEKIDYKGMVYCVEVPNHTWYVKQNDNTHWTKNCNHPETSSIDLSRLAMNIVELHWENRTLVGKMEIPITEGFRNLGIISCCADQVAQWLISGLKIGVSSRALGSVTQVMDKLIVGDDLELICWDVVANPSTNSAYVELNPSDLKPYIEAKEGDGSKLIKEDKFSKFDSWLND